MSAGNEQVSYEISERPKMPVIWLDTHAISQLATAIARPTDDEANVYLRDLYERLVSLRKANRIFAFESDQLDEIEVRPELLRPASDVLTHLSQGVRTHHQHATDMQLQLGMRAAVSKSSKGEIPWRSAFMTHDPLEDKSTGGFFVKVRFDASPVEIAKRRASNAEIAQRWEEIRKGQVATKASEHERWQSQLSQEQLAMQTVLQRTLDEGAMNMAPTTDDTMQQWGILGVPLAYWRAAGGSGFEDMHAFYGSPHYLLLPSVEISLELVTQKVVAGEQIKPSDVMDIYNISSFLPYCTHMVLDRSMINATTKLKLDERYGTQLLRLRDLGGVLDALGLP